MRTELSRKILKTGILLFIGGMIGGMVVAVSTSRLAINKVIEVKHTADSLKIETKQTKDSTIVASIKDAMITVNVDSIIKKKIDDRHKSYDERLWYEYGGIVNNKDSIIGVPVIIITKEQLEDYYEGREKTKFYENLKTGRIRTIKP